MLCHKERGRISGNAVFSLLMYHSPIISPVVKGRQARQRFLMYMHSRCCSHSAVSELLTCGLARLHETWCGLLESLSMEYVDVMIDALSETVHVRFGQATTMVSLRVRICACSGGWGAGGGGLVVRGHTWVTGPRSRFFPPRYRVITLLAITFNR